MNTSKAQLKRTDDFTLLRMLATAREALKRATGHERTTLAATVRALELETTRRDNIERAA